MAGLVPANPGHQSAHYRSPRTLAANPVPHSRVGNGGRPSRVQMITEGPRRNAVSQSQGAAAASHLSTEYLARLARSALRAAMVQTGFRSLAPDFPVSMDQLSFAQAFVGSRASSKC